MKMNPENVVTYWVCENDQCEEPQDERSAEVDVTYFQDNGTPQCGCGDDMTFDSVDVQSDAIPSNLNIVIPSVSQRVNVALAHLAMCKITTDSPVIEDAEIWDQVNKKSLIAAYDKIDDAIYELMQAHRKIARKSLEKQ